jgi:hypothetical protein
LRDLIRKKSNSEETKRRPNDLQKKRKRRNSLALDATNARLVKWKNVVDVSAYSTHVPTTLTVSTSLRQNLREIFVSYAENL